jgi:transposase-like protein
MQPKWEELRIIKWATRKTIAAQVEKMDPEIKRIFKKPKKKKRDTVVLDMLYTTRIVVFFSLSLKKG